MIDTASTAPQAGQSGTVSPSWQTWLTLSFALLALILMSLSVASLQPGVTDLATLEQGIYYALAGALFLAAALLSKPVPLMSLSFSELSLQGYSNWIAGLLGVLALLAFAESGAHMLGIAALDPISHYTQFYLLVGGCLLMIWGFGGVGWPWRWYSHFKNLSRTDWLEIGFIVLITLLGAGTRFWRLDTGIHQFVDELNFATVTAYFWSGNHQNLLEPAVRGFPLIYPFMQDEMSSVFGRNLFGMRATSAILGTLGVPATYLLTRALFDRRTAVVAGLLIVAFPPHVHFSRLALNNIADASFGVLALAFIARGWRYNHRLDFVIGGVALGLTQYFYEGGRLIFPPLVIGWCIHGLLVGYGRRRIRGILLMGFVAIVVAAPIYLTLDALDAQLTPRANTTGEQDDLVGLYENTQDTDVYLPKLRQSFRVYFGEPESFIIWYGGSQPMILLFLAPLFLLGVAYVVLTSYGPNIVFPAWIVATSIGISLINDTGAYVRYVGVFPALVITIAVGVRVLFGLIIPPAIPQHSPARFNVLLMIAVLLCGIHTQFYFGPQLNDVNRQLRRQLAYDGQDIAFRMVDEPQGARVYILADGVEDERYLNGVLGYMIDNSHQAIQVQSPSDIDRIFLYNIPVQGLTYLAIPYDADKKSLLLVYRVFVLSGPMSTPYNVPYDKQLLMYEILGYRTE